MIRIRNAALSLLALQPHSLSMPVLREALATHPALAGLDETLPVVLDLSAVEEGEADWSAVREALRLARLQPIGVRNGSPQLRAQASREGWADLGLTAPNLPVSAAVAVEAEAVAQPAMPAPPGPDAPAQSTPAPTLIIDRPLRSGQKVYARGADAVVLAMVSAGAEIIADGSIHVYAPLRGRALAGAAGDTRARIFTLGFEPELVSIAGVWRNFEQGHDRALLRKSVQIRLEVSETGERLQMAVISA